MQKAASETQSCHLAPYQHQRNESIGKQYGRTKRQQAKRRHRNRRRRRRYSRCRAFSGEASRAFAISKEASQPFAAMLGPNWKEGHNMLERNGPLELLLPEDDAAALQLICAIVHHRNSQVSPTLAAGDVLGVAVTADKYDFVAALKFASGDWLRPGKREAADLLLLTTAAYLFQNA